MRRGQPQVVEVPPGPPVWSPIVAEVYGPTQAAREAAARAVQARFVATADLVDVDIYLTDPSPSGGWWWIAPRRPCSGSISGIWWRPSTGAWVIRMPAGCGGKGAKYPVPIRIELAPGDKRDLTGILALKVRSQSGQLVRVSELVSRRDEVAPATSCTRTCSPW